MKAVRFFAFGFVIFCSGCGPLTPRQVEEPFSILSRQRLEAEGGVKWLKTHPEADAAAIQKGRRLYQKARDAYAGWIAQAESDLYYGHRLGEDTYNESLTKPVASAYDFIHYAENLGQRPAEPQADHVNPTAANMAAALLRIWNTHRISGKEQKDAIVKNFEKLKWRSFEAVV